MAKSQHRRFLDEYQGEFHDNDEENQKEGERIRAEEADREVRDEEAFLDQGFTEEDLGL